MQKKLKQKPYILHVVIIFIIMLLVLFIGNKLSVCLLLPQYNVLSF